MNLKLKNKNNENFISIKHVINSSGKIFKTWVQFPLAPPKSLTVGKTTLLCQLWLKKDPFGAYIHG